MIYNKPKLTDVDFDMCWLRYVLTSICVFLTRIYLLFYIIHFSPSRHTRFWLRLFVCILFGCFTSVADNSCNAQPYSAKDRNQKASCCSPHGISTWPSDNMCESWKNGRCCSLLLRTCFVTNSKYGRFCTVVPIEIIHSHWKVYVYWLMLNVLVVMNGSYN